MNLLEIIALAVALGCDAFAVGLGVGARWHGGRQMFRLSFHFGFFQFAMPILGWLVGREAMGLARQGAPWLAFFVLLFLGVKMIREGLSGKAENPAASDPTRGLSLVMLSVATSLDALGVGFGLGLVRTDIIFSAVVIGLIAAAMTLAAMQMGRRLSARFGRGMDMAGGVILVLLAVKIILG
jgi:putative Mn2+ efflux pump MntP